VAWTEPHLSRGTNTYVVKALSANAGWAFMTEDSDGNPNRLALSLSFAYFGLMDENSRNAFRSAFDNPQLAPHLLGGSLKFRFDVNDFGVNFTCKLLVAPKKEWDAGNMSGLKCALGTGALASFIKSPKNVE
jgi:hypothetical protein